MIDPRYRATLRLAMVRARPMLARLPRVLSLVVLPLATAVGLGCQPEQGAPVPPSAVPDVEEISKGDQVDFHRHLAAGKVTVFDFYAEWCKPCKEVDRHLAQVLATRGDVALRKIDVIDWDSEAAKTHLRYVPNLPYVVVYGRNGKEVAKISGLRLDALDDAIEKGSRK